MSSGIESLKKIHTVLVDTQHGYEEAIKEDGDSDLAPIFSEMIDLRQRDRAEIHQILAAKGEKADDGGSFMSAVQRAVIDVRSSLTGLDKNALPAFIRGEESVIGYYDDALKEWAADAEVSTILTRQKRELQEKVSKMKLKETA
jgi:uncharacterized protein (TIGR02284 family)